MRGWRGLMGAMFTSMGQDSRRDAFYRLSSTCQIPNLGRIYEQYFGKVTDGSFVEIGAFDGDYVSNTSGLADIGWTGVYVEPVRDFFVKCQLRHKKNKVKVINAAVGEREGSLVIDIGGPLSTAKKVMKENFENLAWAKPHFKPDHTCTATLVCLDRLLEEEAIGRGFELLVVDVEGYEWNVLQGFNIRKWEPQMVIIELHDQNDDYFHIRAECMEIVRYFDEADYKVIFKDFSNTIYVPKKHFPISIEKR